MLFSWNVNESILCKSEAFCLHFSSTHKIRKKKSTCVKKNAMLVLLLRLFFSCLWREIYFWRNRNRKKAKSLTNPLRIRIDGDSIIVRFHWEILSTNTLYNKKNDNTHKHRMWHSLLNRNHTNTFRMWFYLLLFFCDCVLCFALLFYWQNYFFDGFAFT